MTPDTELSSSWRTDLPVLSSRLLTLREPTPHDLGPLIDLLSTSDATRFGIEGVVTGVAVQQLIDRARRERGVGLSFTYVITPSVSRAVVGLVQVRQLDPAFETAEWECTVASSARGSGLFLDAARLVGSFTFGAIGTYRLEARVLVQNGRANGALRKLGCVQEDVLRRSLKRGDAYLDQALSSILREDWGDRWVSTAPRVH